MAHIFRAQTFITPASAHTNSQLDGRGNNSMAKEVEDYITTQDGGGGSNDIDQILSVSSCSLSGDRVFTIVVLEDQTSGGG